MKKLALLLLLITIANLCHAQSPQDLKSLFEAEKAFSARSEEVGTKTAFLENLSQDAILFRRGIVNGMKFWQDSPGGNGKLIWRPAFGDISESGDLGYTTGPFQQFKNRGDSVPSGTGHYISIWQKTGDTWKVTFDAGIGHQAQADQKTNEAHSAIRTRRSDTSLESVQQIESAFVEGFHKLGYSAYTPYLSTEARFYRPMKAPYSKGNLQELFNETDKKFSYTAPQNGKVAASGDLAYFYGPVAIEITGASGARQLTGSYLRIWKLEDGVKWKIVVDLISI